MTKNMLSAPETHQGDRCVVLEMSLVRNPCRRICLYKRKVFRVKVGGMNESLGWNDNIMEAL